MTPSGSIPGAPFSTLLSLFKVSKKKFLINGSVVLNYFYLKNSF
jgi:hypothetical protein